MGGHAGCDRCGRRDTVTWCDCCRRALCDDCHALDSDKRIARAKVRSARAESWWYRGKGERQAHGHARRGAGERGG